MSHEDGTFTVYTIFPPPQQDSQRERQADMGGAAEVAGQEACLFGKSAPARRQQQSRARAVEDGEKTISACAIGELFMRCSGQRSALEL